ncbi:hypothetical protein ACS0TY_030676 [Phlomoides rotata]
MEQPSMIRISTTSFWTRVFDLPLVYHSDKVLRLIAMKVGDLECFESVTEGESSRYLCFKVNMGITRPLLKGITIWVAGELLWLPLKYEALPYYYYYCGIMGHFFKDCKFYDRDETLVSEELSYGPFLKASSLRRSRGVKPVVVYVDRLSVHGPGCSRTGEKSGSLGSGHAEVSVEKTAPGSISVLGPTPVSLPSPVSISPFPSPSLSNPELPSIQPDNFLSCFSLSLSSNTATLGNNLATAGVVARSGLSFPSQNATPVLHSSAPSVHCHPAL